MSEAPILDRWSNLAEILEDANVLRSVKISWRGRPLRVFFRELKAKDVPIREVASVPDETGAVNRADFVEKYDKLVLKMITGAAAENAAEGFPITESNYYELPLMLRMMIFGAISESSAGLQKDFLPSPPKTP